MTVAAGAGDRQRPDRPDQPRPAGPRPGSIVLIVEDDGDIAALMAQCLREAGYRSLHAADGAEALAITPEPGARIALVLLDWRLPGALWGKPLLQQLRARFSAPVVVISADPASLADASAAGAADYLPKPFQLADLIHVVDDHCH